jgi:hypothetical protein
MKEIKMNNADWADKILTNTEKLSLEEMRTKLEELEYKESGIKKYNTIEGIAEQVKTTLDRINEHPDCKESLLLPYVLVFYYTHVKKYNSEELHMIIYKVLVNSEEFKDAMMDF